MIQTDDVRVAPGADSARSVLGVPMMTVMLVLVWSAVLIPLLWGIGQVLNTLPALFRGS